MEGYRRSSTIAGITRGTLWVGLLLATAGCGVFYTTPNVWVEDERKFTIGSAGIDSIKLTTHNGKIDSTASADVTDIVVIANIRAGGADLDDARACLDALELEVAAVGTRVEGGWTLERGNHQRWGASVAFHVTQPPTIPVEFRSHNGGILVIGLRANVDAETHNGAVTAQSVTGDVRAVTHNGRVELSGAVAEFDVLTHNGGVQADIGGVDVVSGHAETHNGAVSLALGDSDVEITAETHNGRVSPSSRYAIIERSERGHYLRARHGNGSGKVGIVTHNGGIEIR